MVSVPSLKGGRKARGSSVAAKRGGADADGHGREQEPAVREGPIEQAPRCRA